jgi:hypothetical protein
MEQRNGYSSDAISAPEATDSWQAVREPSMTARVPLASGPSVEWGEPCDPASSAEELATQPEARAPELDDIEDGVRRAVQQARAEIEEGLLRLEQASPSDYTSEAMQAAATEPEDAQREDVRRLVEQARAELEGPTLVSMMPQPQFGGTAASRWQAANESMLPPVLVIEDNDGRVDLARVYEALSRLSCGGDASLLNHTPHSVTMGFNSDDKVPGEEPLANEVRAVFGRECQVTRDGNRTSVRIGGAREQRFSA